MLSDLMCMDGYCMANRKVMRLFGRDVAIYWAELTSIATKVVRKGKFDSESGFFRIDRDYVEERTTLTLDEQYDCDLALSKAGVLSEAEGDRELVSIDARAMVALVAEEDPKILKSIAKQCKVNAKAAKANKQEAVLATMKRLADDPDPDVKAKYDDWVESVYANKRYLTKAVIKLFQADLNSYSQDKGVKMAVLNVAISLGYTNFDWVREAYERNHKRALASPMPNDPVSVVGVKKGVSF